MFGDRKCNEIVDVRRKLREFQRAVGLEPSLFEVDFGPHIYMLVLKVVGHTFTGSGVTDLALAQVAFDELV